MQTEHSFELPPASFFPLLFATVILIVHVAFGGAYGFHRDELATLEDARHLAWGYVAYPPLTPFFGRLSLELFGTSLAGFRFFAALAQAMVVILTGLMARDLGARSLGQSIAALAALPFALAAGTLMQYVSFDCLWWVVTAFCVIRLLRTRNDRWWLGIGIAIGLGLLTKYSMVFFAGSLGLGMLVYPEGRAHLRSKWVWLGAGLAILIFLPNFIWQAQHGFVSLDFLRHIHERDVRIGRTDHFLIDQMKLTLLAFPLAVAGIIYCLARNGQRFRALAVMYLLPFIFFVVAKGRSYYLAAAYPMLYAAGAAWFDRSLRDRTPVWRNVAAAMAITALILDIFAAGAFTLPLSSPGTERFARVVKEKGDFAEELGWPELVAEVARIRDSLPEAERSGLGILAGNYGEAGAVNLYGPAHGLPRAISGINSFWAKGFGDPAPQTLIVLGLSRKFLNENFSECSVAGHVPNPYGIENEENRDHPDIFVCRGLRKTWPDFWKHHQYYGLLLLPKRMLKA